jgi:segregation and condensation protein B
MDSFDKSPIRRASEGLGEGLSLDALTAGFAEIVSRGEDPYQPAAPAKQPSAAQSPGEAGPEVTPRGIVEAMLFVGHPQNEPLTSQQMAALMRGVNAAELDEIIRDLNEQYARNACPYTIESRGAGYALTLLPEFASARDRVLGRVRQARLSQAAIEVLALVAYNGSITCDEIARTRGRPSGAILLQLVRRQLLKVERTEGKPRENRYSTTSRFLELFGLESLEDLPRSQEVDQR